MFGGKGNKGASRSGVRIDKGVGGNSNAIECAGDFLGRIEAPPVGIHFNHDRACFGRFRQLDSAPEKKRQRWRNFASQREDNSISFTNDVARVHDRWEPSS